jgi:curved DNA-binding protein CbpA
MALSEDERLEPTGAAMDGLPLTPEDFFVFSRIDGNATVHQLIVASGLDSATATKTLEKLVELGLVKTKGAAAAKPATKPRKRAATNEHLRDAAARRRKQMLRAQFKVATGSHATVEQGAKSGSASAPAPEPEPEPEPEGPQTRVQPVAENDPRLDPSLAIPVEHQRLVLGIVDDFKKLTHFDLLGIAPTNDKKAIRRAYHQASRRLHPDAYYGKELGNFKTMLDQLFKRARASYELLTDDAKREAYVERLLAEHEKHQAERRKLREGEQQARAEKDRLEAERRALEEQRRQKEEDEKRSAERKAREERDRKRKLRQSQRLSPLEGRQRQAKEQFERGLKELKAKRPGAAASLFRIAMDMDPSNEEYHEHWQRSLAEAKMKRAEKAFDTAKQYEEMGRMAEAAHYYGEAAMANPTPHYLGYAALAMREDDPGKARELALRALDGIVAAEKMGAPIPAKEAGSVHLKCGFVFLAAKQVHSAKEQADAAAVKLGETDNVKALRTAIKAAKN